MVNLGLEWVKLQAVSIKFAEFGRRKLSGQRATWFYWLGFWNGRSGLPEANFFEKYFLSQNTWTIFLLTNGLSYWLGSMNWTVILLITDSSTDSIKIHIHTQWAKATSNDVGIRFVSLFTLNHVHTHLTFACALRSVNNPCRRLLLGDFWPRYS